MELTLRCIPVGRIPCFALFASRGGELEFSKFDRAVRDALEWQEARDLVVVEKVSSMDSMFPYTGPWTTDEIFTHADKVAATLGVRVELDDSD